MTAPHAQCQPVSASDILLGLADRCEKATGPDRELDAQIVVALDLRPDWLTKDFGELWVDDANKDLIVVRFKDRAIKKRGPGNPPIGEFPSYTASIDAAMMLVPEGMWGEGSLSSPAVIEVHDNAQYQERGRGHAATPALALCAAALRARSKTS